MITTPVGAICWRALFVTAIAGLVLLAAGPAAYAGHKPHQHKPHRHRPPVGLPTPPPVPAGQLGQDLSGKLPVMNINEAPGDYLGEGHDQIASVLNGDLNIYESNKYGGGPPKVKTPTDLKAPPNDPLKFNCQGVGLCQLVSPWGQADNTQAEYERAGSDFSLTSVKVAASASNIYMAGATFDPSDPLHTYQLHLYKLPHDGSCASTACFGPEEKSVSLPNLFHTYTAMDPSVDERLVVATSLATGVVGGKTYIAVGLSDGGLYMFDENLNQVARITDMAVDCSQIVCDGQPQTPVISLGFGAPGTPAEGYLAVGVESPWLNMYTYKLTPEGQEDPGACPNADRPPNEGWCSRQGGNGITNVPMSAAVGMVDGQVKSMFGLSSGIVYVLYPNGPAFTSFNTPAAVLGLNPVTSAGDDPTNQKVAVGIEGDQGEVLKWDGSALKPVPILASGATSGNWDQVRRWYPGYGAGRLRVANDTGGEVKVSMHWRPVPLFGCWLNDSVGNGDVPAFPGDPTSIAPGQSLPASSSFFIGALAAASNGSCASGQPGDAGEWSAYVVITPADDQADQHIVKLLVQGPGQVSIQQQVGGDVTANLTGPGLGGSWGSWVLHVGGHSAAVAQTAPVLLKSSQRLTSAATGPCATPPVLDDPCRPVYRFDVSGAQWSGVAVNGQVAARIPPMTAEGTSDGVSWRPLGQLMPVTAPTVSGNTVTLGESSFFWQDAPDHPALTAVRVVSGGKASNVVRLADLAAPALDGNGGEAGVDGLTVAAPGGAKSVTLRPNGVDQARLFLSLSPSTAGGDIAPNDRRYGLVYYRYDNNGVPGGLITGLYTPGDYSDYVAVGPWAGAYPDNGLGRGRRGARGRRRGGAIPQSYLVTTNTVQQGVAGVLNDTGVPPSTGVSRELFVVPDLTQLQASGTADGGIEVPGCGSTCTLAPTGTTPALFQAGDADQGPVSGLLFSAPAVTAVDSLPMQLVASDQSAAHSLGSMALQVNANQARLTNTSQFWPCDPIDTVLVTSGERVLAPSIPAKSGC